MIRKERYTVRADGMTLLRTFSDDGMMLRKDAAGELYAEAIDIENSTNSYTETNVPAEMDRELTVEDMIEMLKELGVDTDDQQA